MTNDTILKVGVLGYGKMGQTRAAQVSAHPNGEVIKVFDVFYEDKPELPKAKDMDEIINDPDIDVVFICLPNYLNKEKTIQCLRAGKHVFCEKPPAFTGDEVREIIEIEKLSKKKLMYGFNHRQHAAIRKMKALIDSGDYGDILWMRGRYGKSVDGQYLKTWRANKELAGGGILLDQGIHMLDLMLHFGGNFDDVKAVVSNRFWKTEGIEDNVFAILNNTQTGLVCSFHSTMTQWRHLFSLEVFLERGHMSLNGLKTSSNSYGKEELHVAKNRSKAPAAEWSDEERFTYDVDVSWEAENTMFFDAILNEKKITAGSSRNALDVMDLIDQIYKSDRQEATMLHEDLQQNHGIKDK